MSRRRTWRPRLILPRSRSPCRAPGARSKGSSTLSADSTPGYPAGPARAPIFQVDAFADGRFTGNPAAVVVLGRFPADPVLQAVAAENNLAETAFLVPDGEGYRIRWFTPAVEVALCGHATLASAAVVMEELEPGRASVVFQSPSGPLPVHRAGDGYVMDFPARSCERVDPPGGLAAALGAVPAEVHAGSANYLAVLHSAAQVRELRPDFASIARLGREGVIVTAEGEAPYDFTSRYFAPAKGIPEDPVTGGAHCMLAPFWATRLGKAAFRARQASQRGGDVRCAVAGDRVTLAGSCAFYLHGEIEI
jgi:PhzF family phenazine biosynthesis protein